MEIFRRIFSFILAGAIFIVTSGFSLHKHYCGDKMVSSHASFLKHGEHGGCDHKHGNEAIEVSAKKNLDLTTVAAGCCKDVFASFKLDDDFSNHLSQNLDFSVSAYPVPDNYIVCIEKVNASNEVYHFSNFPPWKDLDPFSLYQSYLL